MKRAVSILLVLIMLFSSLSLTAFAEEEVHILFEDDFSREAIAWKLEGSKWQNGHIELHTTGWQWARMVDTEFLFYNPYTAEFDVTIVGGVDGSDDWFSFNMGGVMIFFRLALGTVHGSANSSESKIGNAKLEIGKTYRIKAVAGNNYIAVYYKGKDDASYRDIGMYAKENNFPKTFFFTSMMVDYDIDNIVFTSNGGDVVPDKKVRYLEVGETDKIVLTGSKASGCTFESQKSDVVSVESDGTITAKKSGGAKIDVKDKDGNIVECVYVLGVQTPTTLSFNYNPMNNASVYKDSNLYDEEKIVMYENDVCDLRVYFSAGATLQSVNWSVEPAGIVDLWGTSTTSPTRTITALKAGECVVTAKSAFSAAEAKMAIKVLPESEREIAESSTYDFYSTGKTHNINKEIVGAHIAAPHTGDKEEHQTSWHVEDIGLYSTRSSTSMIGTTMYDTSIGETPATALYRIANKTGVQLICCLGVNFVNNPDTYEEDIQNIVAYVKDIKQAYDGQLYIELFNEVFSIGFKTKFPTVDYYVDFCKRLITELRKVDPDAIFIACGIDYNTVVNVTADMGNFNTENVGDPAYTQGGRIAAWTDKIKTLIDEGYVKGVTIHNYQSYGSHLNGLVPKNAMKIRSAVVEMNYMGQLYDSKRYGYPDFYFTEWGQLEALIYWGPAASSPAEKIKYNYQKYPVSGLFNLAQLLNYAKTEDAKAAHFHTIIGGDGFGIIDDVSTNRDYQIPNEIVFKQMSKVVVDTPVFYDLKPLDMDYVPSYRPAWNKFPEEVLQVANVESWGFGDESGLKQVAFFNQTDAPQKVKIGGTTLKPTWAYGGDTDKLFPDFLKNEAYSSWNLQLTKDLANADEYTWLPETYEGADFAEEIEIPPYTILFADVSGTPQTAASTADKVSTLANYALRNSIVLGVGKANAYVDNVQKQIDENIAVTPIVENGRTLLPLRFVAESLGCDVEFNDATQEITVKNKTTEIQLKLGDSRYTVNGEEKFFDVPASERDGRTLLPLRALAESLGKDVYWNDRGYIIVGTKSIYIDSEIEYYFDEISKLYL